MLHYLPILTNVLQCLRTFPLKSNSYTFEISLTWILYPAHDLKFCFAISSHCIIYLAGIKASSNCNCCQESTWVSVCKYFFFYWVCKITNCLEPKYISWDSAKLLFRISFAVVAGGGKSSPHTLQQMLLEVQQDLQLIRWNVFQVWKVQVSSRLKTSRGWPWSYQQLKSQCLHLSSISVLKVYLG